jgi:hypothetical protein
MSDEDRQLSREMIATHELAHGVGFRACGLQNAELRVVSYWFNDGAHGWCRAKEKWLPFQENGLPTTEMMEGYLVAIAAGQAGVDRFFELRDEPTRFTAADDFAQIRQLTREVYEMPEHEIKARAKALVLQHWVEIVELAPVLAERGRLAGSKVR